MTQEGAAMTHHPVIARRAAPWQSMPLHNGPWIASFLAMTQEGGAMTQGVAMTHHPVIARRHVRPVIARRAAPWQSMPSHNGPCIASFLAMTQEGVAMTQEGVAMTADSQ